jgi:hypothetical protein
MGGKIVAPLKSGELDRIPRKEWTAQIHFHHTITTIRQAAEWANATLKGPFRRLHNKLPVKASTRKELFDLAVHMHQLRTRRIGLNQIKTFYDVAWIDGAGRGASAIEGLYNYVP